MRTRLAFRGREHNLAALLRNLLPARKPRQPQPLERRVAVELLEPRIVLASALTLTDSDGDVYTVKLTGAGTADVVQAEDGLERGPIFSITLGGTTKTSALAIIVKKATGGDGEVSIASINGNAPLGSIKALKSDLVGDGIALTATLGSLTLDDVRNGADITVGGTATDKVTMTLGEVGDGTTITSASQLKTLTAAGIGDGAVAAPLLGSLKTTAGGMAADLNIAGAAGAISVKGGNAAGEWTAASFGKVTVTDGSFTAKLTSTAAAAALGKKLALAGVSVVGGDFTGDISAFGNAGAISLAAKKGLGGTMNHATLAAKSFAGITVAKDVSASLLLAGTHLGSDRTPGGVGDAADAFGPGSIAKFSVGGTVANSVLGAGLTSFDDVLGNADDGITGGATSKVKTFAIKGDATLDSVFAAAVFPKTVKIGLAKITPPADPRFLTTGSPDVGMPLIAAALAKDTGLMADDGVTSDPTIAGVAADNLLVTTLNARFGAGAFVNVTTALKPDGSFTLDLARLKKVIGGSLPDGSYTLQLQALDAAGNATLFDVAFTLDKTAPGAPTLGLSPVSDTGTPGDGITSAGVVTIAGATDANALVQIGAKQALATGTGNFVLPGVALANGANNFTASVTDLAGNRSKNASVTITRSSAATTDVVLEWNTVNLEAIRLDATPPPPATRGLAMVSTAMFDVVSAFEGTPGFFVTQSAPAGAASEAAIAAAAHRVLSYLYPGQQAFFDASLTTTLARVPDGAAETAGVNFGAALGQTIIDLRYGDGFNEYTEYLPGTAPGDWQPTAPMFDVALLPNWATLDPFAMNAPDQFRPDGPAALDSAEYAAALNDVKQLGAATGGTRTAVQTEIARFWADGPGTITPAGHWNQIAMQLAVQQGLSVSANARLFAELNVTLADASIVAWDAKYEFEFWRPITAIQNADLDGNAATVADPDWRSLLITPPFPDYVSGHSTYSGAAAEILGGFFGETVGFTTRSPGLPGVMRTFTSFEQAAEEAGRSRVYGGIHFEFANQDGLAAGRELAGFIHDRFALTGDFFAPRILLEGPASGLVTSTGFNVEGRVLDNLSGVISLRAQLDSGAIMNVAFDAEGDFSVPVTLPLTEGAHVLRLFADDLAGNAATPLDFAFTLDTVVPSLNVTGPFDDATIAFGAHLTGSANPTGSALTALNFRFDTGPVIPLSFDAATGAFDTLLDLSKLVAGAHTLTVSAQDAAGLVNTTTLDVQLAAPIPFALAGVTPGAGSPDVGTTFRPQVFFSRPVDPASLNANNLFATDTAGNTLDATIVPAMDGSFAWLFFDEPLPGGAVTTIHVEGATILAASGGAALDADRDGTPGGSFSSTFTTVSLTPVAGTTLTGRVFDPGADLKPMTFDDIRAGADGILHTADDVFLNPLAGVKLFIIGLENQPVFTDAQGNFSFLSTPAGNVKLAIDGHTATNAPAGVFFPEMVMDLVIQPGLANTVIGTMGTREEMLANLDRPEVYLPRIQSSILQSVSGAGITMVGVNADAAPNLTPEQRSQLTLAVQGGSLIGFDGQPLANPQIGISTVPPELVREMLPPGVLQHTFDITIQAPDAATFSAPATLTFPNVFNAAPGTKLDFLSFDHTTGRLVIEGTATVSADGLTATTDPGIGITKPGWHGLTPPGLCGGSGGPPLMPPPEPGPMDTVNIHDSVARQLIIGQTGMLPALMWTAPAKVPGTPEPTMQPGCNVPQRPPPGMTTQPFLNVTIQVDGPLATFMKKPGSLSGGLDLISQSFTLAAGQEGTVIFAGEAKNYEELFGAGGFDDLSRDQLYGSKIKVTEILQKADGTRQYDIYTYYLYRWVDVIDADLAKDKTGNTAAFLKTLDDDAGGFVRSKFVDAHLPGSVTTNFQAEAPFDVNDPGSGERLVLWNFDPLGAADFSKGITITVDDPALPGGAVNAVGSLFAKGTGVPKTKLSVNLDDAATGYKAELKRVLLSLVDVYYPGPDGQAGRAGMDDDANGSLDKAAEYGAAGSDDILRTMYVYAGKTGFLEQTIGGPDGRHGVAGADDDNDGTNDNGVGELGAAGSDDRDVRIARGASVENRDFKFVTDRFKALFAGFMPSDRAEAGPDGKLGTRDDQFSAAQLMALDARIDLEAAALLDEVKKDFDPIKDAIIFQTDNAGADVVMDWRDVFSGASPIFGGTSQYDSDVAKMRELIGTPDRTDPITGNKFTLEISSAAQQWAMAQYINRELADNGAFGVGIHLGMTDVNTTFAQYVANTVSHELAHTYGLNEGYYVGTAAHRHGVAGDGAGNGGTALINARNNAFPYQSLMNNGGAADADFAFKRPSDDILRAAAGLAPNLSLGLSKALDLWRDSFNLVNGRYADGTHDANGFRDEEPFPETDAQLSLFDGVQHLFGIAGESLALGRAPADGAGGQTLSFDFDLKNEGVVPLVIASLGFLGGGAGFSVLTSGLVGTPIDPGEEVTLSIGFDPAALGAASDTLRIQSNAGFMPDFKLPLSAEGFSFAPLGQLTVDGNNNLGGLKVEGGATQKTEFATVTNDGFQPLLLSDIRLVEGVGPFSVLGLPVDLATNPISLDTGESFTFGLGFDPQKIGLERAVFEVVTNAPANSILRGNAVGTGLASVVYPQWGEDFVAFETPNLATSIELRAKSDESGSFEFFMPQEQFYHLAVFDPATGLVSHGYGTTPRSGGGFDLTASLVFQASTAPDTDGDGLPDDVEFAIGTGAGKVDSDNDGLRDFVEIQQGTDPLGGRALPTGIVSSAALPGVAKEVVVTGSLFDSGQQTAYVATGTHGLAIVDTSQLTKPVVTGTLDLPGDATDVAVDPVLGVAVIASNAGGLHFVNVADPMAPALVRTLNLNTAQVEVFDGLAYATVGASLRAFDLLTGDEVDTLALGGGTLTELAREGAFFYTLDNANTLRVIDASDTSMVARGLLAVPGTAGNLFVGNGTAFIGAEGSFNGGFATANVSNPNAPALFSGADDVSLAGRDFAGNGSGLGILVGRPGGVAGPNVLDVVSVADLANTGAFLTRVTLPAAPEAVAVGAGIAYVANGTAGLQVVNYLGFDSAGAPPTVGITSPIVDLDGGTPGVQITEGASIPIRVAATDDVQVSRVELLVNGEVTATDLAFPYELGAIGLSSIGAIATVQARAIDTGGNVALSNLLAFQLVPDTFAPQVSLVTPAAGDVQVQGLRTVTVRFNEPVDAATAVIENFTLRNAASDLFTPTNLQLRNDDRTVVLTFAPLPEDMFTLTVDDDVADRAGNLLGTDFTSDFELIAATVGWVGGAAGFWDVAANWSTNALPGATDIVFIPQNVAVTHRLADDTILRLINNGTLTLVNFFDLAITGSAQIGGTLVLDGGDLTGAGTVNVSGTLTWREGSMRGAGVTNILAAGNLFIDNGTTFFGKTLDGRTLNNAGSAVWDTTTTLFLSMQSGAVLNNTGTFTSLDDHSFNFNGGTATINNSGTFIKAGGTVATSFGVTFNNTGTVAAQTGAFRFNAGGTHTGTFSAAAGAANEFTGATHVLNTGAAMTGAGEGRLTGGTLNVAGTATAVNFEMSNGTLNGIGTLTTTGNFEWAGGSMSGAGTTAIAATGTFAVSGTGAKFFDVRTLSNAGTGTWTGTGAIFMGNGAVFTNSGTFTSTGDQAVNNNGGVPVINNSGTFTKSAGTGQTQINVAFNNTGTLDAQSGTIRLNGGGSATGAFAAATGTAIELNGGTFTLNTGATFTGAGTTRLSNGTLTVAGDVTVLQFEQSGGTLNGAGTLTASNTLTWTGGTMAGTGTTAATAAATVTVSGTSAKFLDARMLSNAGTGTWSGTGAITMSNGAVFANSGSFSSTGDQSFNNNGGTASPINNSGTFTKSGGTGQTVFNQPMNNTGTVDVQSGAIRFSAGGSASSTFTAAGGAAVEFNGGTFTLNTGATFTGLGTTRLLNGTLTVADAVSALQFEQSGGTLNGTGTLTASNTLTWTGGTMAGAGTTAAAAAATLSVSGASTKFLDGRTLSNAGTGTWSGAGAITMSNGAVFANSGSFSSTVDQMFNNNGGATSPINNSGTFTKSGGAGQTVFNLPLNNTGTVNAQSGTIRLNAGGSASSTFTASSGAMVEFNGSTFTLNTGASFTGAGTAKLSNGTLTVAGNVGAAQFEQSGGVLNGAGTLTVSNTAAWTGGDMAGSGSTAIGAAAALTLSGSGAKFLDVRTLSNAGTGTVTGTGNLVLANGATFTNSGTFTFESDADIINNGGATSTVSNSGTFGKSVATGVTEINHPFNNTGTVDTQAGTLRFNVGGSASGAFNAASGAVAEFNGSTYTLNTGATFTGLGTARLASGTLTVAGNVAVPQFEMTGGTLNGAGTLTLSNTVTWSGGTMSGAGITSVSAPATLTLSGAGGKFLDVRTLNNAGTATVTGAGSLFLANGATLNNSGGFTYQTDADLSNNGGAASLFSNTGTFTKSAGAATTSIAIPFTNTGSIVVETGTVQMPGGFVNDGTISVRKVATLSVSGAFTNAATGVINLDLGGTAAGSFGRVLVSGAATLAGTLAVFLVDGFVPNVADTFAVLTYTSRTGTFTTITDDDPAHVFNPTYNAANLTLTVA